MQFKAENHVTILIETQPLLPHHVAKQLMLRNHPVFQNEETVVQNLPAGFSPPGTAVLSAGDRDPAEKSAGC